MSKKKKKNTYDWAFKPVGGSVRVNIRNGEDIKHLGELDRKLWTVLSCPVTGLEFDEKSLALMDGNGDGKLRVDEVIVTAQWLTSVLKDPDILLKGCDTLAFTDFNEENEEGRKLLASAKQILANLKLEKDSISIEDTADNTRIFAETKFNGDGIITPASTDDDVLKGLVTTITETVGKAADRSGADGVNADHIEAFYTACADYAAWKDAGTPDVFPYGDQTAAALAAVQALQDKIADYYMRCKLISFDGAVAGAVDISADKIGAISDGDLSSFSEEIAACPLARPSDRQLLPLKEGINPAWQGAFATLKALVFDVDFPDKEAITEEEWLACVAKFAPYTAWEAAKKGAEVEPLGVEKVKEILAENKKEDLLALVAKDKELEEEALSIEAVGKLLLLNRDFYRFLNNYVAFTDFYEKDKGKKAIFQAGRLYIDQRSTDLCIRVDDMGKHGDMAGLSGMYILYCACTSKKLGKTMNIAAVLTNGDVDDLRVGRNAVFYDRQGVDWDAVVTRIVENPLSVRQAFWAPYKKVGRWISDKVNKSASEKNDKSLADLTAKADTATNSPAGAAAAAKPSSFDIAKFAGIFAAIGMAIAYLTQGIAKIAEKAHNVTIWKVLLIIACIMLVISLPSMFIAWRKLRKRDLGPMLNANGWAINAAAYVRSKFGKSLTSIAKYPKMTAVDPKARRRARIRAFLWSLFGAAVVAAGVLYFTGRLACIGLPYPKEEPATEQVEEAPAPVEEAAETAVVEQVAE